MTKLKYHLMWLRYDLNGIKRWLKRKIKPKTYGTLYLSDDGIGWKAVAIVRNWRYRK